MRTTRSGASVVVLLVFAAVNAVCGADTASGRAGAGSDFDQPVVLGDRVLLPQVADGRLEAIRVLVSSWQ